VDGEVDVVGGVMLFLLYVGVDFDEVRVDV